MSSLDPIGCNGRRSFIAGVSRVRACRQPQKTTSCIIDSHQRKTSDCCDNLTITIITVIIIIIIDGLCFPKRFIDWGHY